MNHGTPSDSVMGIGEYELSRLFSFQLPAIGNILNSSDGTAAVFPTSSICTPDNDNTLQYPQQGSGL
jgi:hypothetical protein